MKKPGAAQCEWGKENRRGVFRLLRLYPLRPSARIESEQSAVGVAGCAALKSQSAFSVGTSFLTTRKAYHDSRLIFTCGSGGWKRTRNEFVIHNTDNNNSRQNEQKKHQQLPQLMEYEAVRRNPRV